MRFSIIDKEACANSWLQSWVSDRCIQFSGRFYDKDRNEYVPGWVKTFSHSLKAGATSW